MEAGNLRKEGESIVKDEEGQVSNSLIGDDIILIHKVMKFKLIELLL